MDYNSKTDNDTFLQGMLGLCELYDKEATDALLAIYSQALAHISADEFKQAIVNVTKQRVYPSMPKPAEIIEALHGSAEGQAIRALHMVEQAIREHGAYATIVFDDPCIHAIIEMVDCEGARGWPGLCAMPADEFKWWRKDFERAYRAYAQHPPLGLKPLLGLHDTDPVMVGDSERCAALLVDSDYNERAQGLIERASDGKYIG